MLERASEAGNTRGGFVDRLRQAVASLSPREWEVIAGLITPVLLAAALLCGEAILRVQQFQAFGPNQAVETRIAEEVWEVIDGRRRPRPNAVMGRIHFNSSGFRGDELAMPKPEGLIRIGFFGTSTTMDPYVDRESDTWEAVAIGRLRETFRACKFDYLNAGVAGETLAGVKKRLIQDGVPFQPDVAVLMVNDVATRGRDLSGEKDNVYKPSWLARRSLLWLKAEKTALSERLKRVAGREDAAKRLDLNAFAQSARQDIRQMLDGVPQLGLLPVLIESSSLLRREQSIAEQAENVASAALYLPNIYARDVTEAYYRFNDELRAAARDYSIPYVETMKAIPGEVAYYADTHHTNPAGSRLLGTAVGDSLAKNPAVRALVRERGKGCMAES